MNPSDKSQLIRVLELSEKALAALQAIRETAKPELGEWSAVQKLYSPEWAHPYHDIIQEIDTFLALQNSDTEEGAL